jgi:hypothetical protein
LKIFVGTTCHPNGAFIFDKFLANQKQVQDNYPDSELILSTSSPDYAVQLEKQLQYFEIKGKVLCYPIFMPEYAKNRKPDYGRDRIWDITAGREAIRMHALSKTQVQGLLFMDSDMIFDPAVIPTMANYLTNYDAVFSGYRAKDDWLSISGFGCCLLSRRILNSLAFRCIEFKNGDMLSEDEVLEYDLNRMGFRVKKGIFLSIDHYKNAVESNHVHPQSVPFLNRLVNNKYIRYILVRTSILFGRNVTFHLKNILFKFFKPGGI